MKVIFLLFLVFQISFAGKFPIGNFTTLAHGVTGEVYFIDNHTLEVKDFNYDGKITLFSFLRNSLIFMSGTGPDAFFYVGKKGTFVHSANQKGIWIPYPIWSRSKLSAYAGKTIHLELDKDININELGWLSVWCRKYAVDFGHVYLIEAVNNPDPVKKIDPDRLDFIENSATLVHLSLNFVLTLLLKVFLA